MKEIINIAEKKQNKSKYLKQNRLVHARANLQRKGLWAEKIALCAFNWEYLCRTHSIRNLIASQEFDILRTKPHILLRSRDIRDKNDVNHIKALAALSNLSFQSVDHLTKDKSSLKFQFFAPSISKHKNHRKLGGTDSSVYMVKKIFRNYFDYLRFIGFFMGYLIPEMQKRHMTFSYQFFNLRNDQNNLSASWHLFDLPQLLTSSLFPSSLYDYYDWSNSSLTVNMNFLTLMQHGLENDENIEDNNINLISHKFDLFWNYFKLL
jgi:hypothetical protein